jgi:hypothetical protein
MGYESMQTGSFIVGCLFLLALLGSFILGLAKKGNAPGKALTLIFAFVGFALMLSPQLHRFSIEGPGFRIDSLYDHTRILYSEYAKVIQAYAKTLPPEKQRALDPTLKEVQEVEQKSKEPPKSRDQMLDRIILYSGTSQTATADLMQLGILPTWDIPKNVKSQ